MTEPLSQTTGEERRVLGERDKALWREAGRGWGVQSPGDRQRTARGTPPPLGAPDIPQGYSDHFK